MTYNELLELAHRAEGKVLRTITGKEFRVGVYLDCPFFTPLSTGNGRSDGRKAAERFLERAEDLEPGAPAVGYWRTRLADEQDRAKRGGTTTAPAIAAPQRGRLPGGAGTR